MTEAIDHLSDMLERLKGLALRCAWILLAVVPAIHFFDINGVVGSLLAKARAMQLDSVDLEGFGAKITLHTVTEALKGVGQADSAKQKSAFAAAQDLTKDQFVRLMNVGRVKNTCEFANPDHEARRFAELDHRLEYKGLVTLADDPAARKALMSKPVGALGRPTKCYVMALTPLGYDVASALIASFSETFATASDGKS